MNKLFFLLLTFSSFIIHPSSFAVAASCSEGPITSSCQCGASMRSNGYCCDVDNGDMGVWFRGDYYDKCPSATDNYRYVKNDGNDANKGLTPATAWRTMEHITNELTPGQTGLIMGGTWNEQTRWPDGSLKICENVAVTLYPSRSGTPGNPIIFKGHPDYGKPLIEAKGFDSPHPISVQCDIGNCIHRPACIFGDYVILDNFEITESYGGIRTVGTSTVFQDCLIHDTYKNVGSSGENLGGITFLYSPSYDSIIRGCEFHHVAGGSPAISVYRTKTLLIENNYIHDNAGGIQFKNGVSNGTVRWNTFKNIGSASISHSCSDTPGIDTGNSDIYENVVYSEGVDPPVDLMTGFYFTVNGYAGAYTACEGSDVHDLRVFNNVIFNKYGAGILFHNVLSDGSSDNYERTSLSNNIIMNAGTADNRENLAVFDPDYLVDFKSDYNIYFDTFETEVMEWRRYNSYTLNVFRTTVRPDLEQHSLQQNPLFVNPDGGDFRLRSGSPAIDAGTIVSGYHCPVSGDIDPTQTGCKLWYGSAPDIGAFEYNPGLPKDKLPPAKPKGLVLR